MKQTVIIIDWHEDSDPETVEVKSLDWCDGIYNAGIPYGVIRVHVSPEESPEQDT